MKNHWIRLRRSKQFKAIVDNIGKRFFPISGTEMQYLESPIYKVYIKAASKHICTIWLSPTWQAENTSAWQIGYYKDSPKDYLVATLPSPEDTTFYGTIYGYVQHSMAAHQLNQISETIQL